MHCASQNHACTLLHTSINDFKGADTQNSVRHAIISLTKFALLSSVTGTSLPFSMRSTIQKPQVMRQRIRKLHAYHTFLHYSTLIIPICTTILYYTTLDYTVLYLSALYYTALTYLHFALLFAFHGKRFKNDVRDIMGLHPLWCSIVQCR
jgi:hypothetical protein